MLDGWWTDAGTFESLYRAAKLVAEGGANQVEPETSAVAGASTASRDR
jgi:glucose-1-phosphate thymidylyltransferase